MRKVLFWMCVLLLPVIGLFGGMGLVPAAKPLWHRSLASPCKVLGMVEDGRTLLIVQTNKSGELLLIGLDTANGNERFTQVLTFQKLKARASANAWQDYLPELVLSDDGKLIALPAAIDQSYDHVIVLYDWQAEKVVHRIEMPNGKRVPQLSLDRGQLSGFGIGFLLDWKLDEPLGSLEIKMLDDENMRADGICRDANIVYGRSYSSLAGSKILRFYDISKQRNLPAIPVPMRSYIEVLDIHRESVFVLNTRPAKPVSHTLQTFRLQGDQYVHALEMDQTLPANGFPVWEKDYVAISEVRRFNHSRLRFIEWFGIQMLPYMNWLWPEHNLHIYDRKTMKHVLTHSAVSLSTSSTPRQFLLVPERSALVLTYNDVLECWQINSFTRYLPLLGLLIGSLFSLLLIVCRYRRARKLSAATVVC